MPIDPSRWDVAELAARFRAAHPFPHVAVDGFLEEGAADELVAAFDEEAAENLQDEIFDVMASGAPPESEPLRRVHERLGASDVLAAIEAITGEAVRAVETRAYAYLPGHYLLPHADSDDAGRRRVAYALYLGGLSGLSGGELDLYQCDGAPTQIVRTEIAATITPRPGRCVLFAVAPKNLHRVREVLAGARLSLAGWFLQ